MGTFFTSSAFGVAYSPDGSRLAHGGSDQVLTIRDAETGTILHSLAGHSTVISSVEYHPNGRQIVSGSWDHTLIIWNAESGQVIRKLPGHTDAVARVAHSLNGSQFASSSQDKTIRLWDSATGNPLAIINDHGDGIPCFALSPDGSLLASAGTSDRTMRLRDPITNRVIWTQDALPVSLTYLQFSPDGRFILGVDQGGSLCVRDASTGRESTWEAIEPSFSRPAANLLVTPRHLNVQVRRLGSGGGPVPAYIEDRTPPLVYHTLMATEAEKAGDRFALAFHREALARIMPQEASHREAVRASFEANPDHEGMPSLHRRFSEFELARRLRLIPALSSGLPKVLLELPSPLP